jgi:hypothetical protein
MTLENLELGLKLYQQLEYTKEKMFQLFKKIRDFENNDNINGFNIEMKNLEDLTKEAFELEKRFKEL